MNSKIHLTGMENLKGQQDINNVLDSISDEIDSHKWTITTQDYTNLKFEKFLESGQTLQLDKKPQNTVQIIGEHNNRKVYVGDLDVYGTLKVGDLKLREGIVREERSWSISPSGTASSDADYIICTSAVGGQENVGGKNLEPMTHQLGTRGEGGVVQEVASIDNDISDPSYGKEIVNELVRLNSGQYRDTVTYQQFRRYYYYEYPVFTHTYKEGGDTYTRTESALKALANNAGDLNNSGVGYYGKTSWSYSISPFNNQPYDGFIKPNMAEACYAGPYMYYSFMTVFNSTGTVRGTMMKFAGYKRFPTYEDFYAEISKYADSRTSGYIIFPLSCAQVTAGYYDKIHTSGGVKYIDMPVKEYISETFDVVSSGVIKVDTAFRI